MKGVYKMESTCNDVVFGEMSYKHRWYKQQKISIFGKEWDIAVAAKAYSGKPITEAEQNAYKYFEENESKMVTVIGNQLKQYVNDNLQELATYWMGARSVNQIVELAQMVTPKTLLFKQDGTTVMLLDCLWDEDSGIAVKLAPEVAVGSQDIFL